MKWRVRKKGVKRRTKKQWHSWFAWYPVRVPTHGRMSGQIRVWLERVERRGHVDVNYDGFSIWSFEYRSRRI